MQVPEQTLTELSCKPLSLLTDSEADMAVILPNRVLAALRT